MGKLKCPVGSDKKMPCPSQSSGSDIFILRAMFESRPSESSGCSQGTLMGVIVFHEGIVVLEGFSTKQETSNSEMKGSSLSS